MNYAAQTAPQPTESPIPQAIASLSRAHGSLHDTITALVQRLEPILAPQPPAPVGNEAQRTARHSVALQIDAEAQAAMQAGERLASIINRLEL